MASDIWLSTILIVRKETRCRYIGFSSRLTARVLLYAPSHRQDSTYHGWNEKYKSNSNAYDIIIIISDDDDDDDDDTDSNNNNDDATTFNKLSFQISKYITHTRRILKKYV